jgi:hypothetical protein
LRAITDANAKANTASARNAGVTPESGAETNCVW